MKTVVITGGTRGIGRGLTENFLKQGWNVLINGSSSASVEKALEILRQNLDVADAAGPRVEGLSGDVRSRADMDRLFQYALECFTRVDIWVNNAGIGHLSKPVWELTEEQARQVLDVDVMGVLNGASAAISAMINQGFGRIYCMEGFGSDGRLMKGLSVYGAAKRAVRYLSRALALEIKDSPVQLSRISPGIVITDFLMVQYQSPEAFEKAKPIYNILGDRVERVTPWLVQKMIKNQRNGAYFPWLTGIKIMGRFLSAPFRKRDLFKNSADIPNKEGKGSTNSPDQG